MTTDLSPEECKRKWANLVVGLDEPTATIVARMLEEQCQRRSAVDRLADLTKVKNA